MTDILTGTPPNLTYLHEAVQQAWMVVWVVVAAGLGVILAWAGITMIFREHLGSHDFGWRELVPRLMIAVVAASTSLWRGSFIIDLADSISRFVAVSLEVTAGDLLRAPLDVFLQAIQVGNTGLALALALLYLVYGFFILYVIGQFIIRLALIDLLLVLAPVALGLWVLPMTAGWGRYWLKTFLVTVFQQSVQLVALALAIAFLDDFASIGAGQPVNDFLWQLLMSIAFVYLTHQGPLDAWHHRGVRRLAAHPPLRGIHAHGPAQDDARGGHGNRRYVGCRCDEGRGGRQWGRALEAGSLLRRAWPRAAAAGKHRRATRRRGCRPAA